MNKLTILTAILSCSFNYVIASDECSDKPECWPEGSAMHTGLLLVERQRNTEKILDEKHNTLVGLVKNSPGADPRLVKAIIAQQVAWLKYRGDECELIGSLSGAGGSWPSTYANKCESNLTDQRLRSVKNALKCIEKKQAEKKFHEQHSCLRQLAPLANK